MRILLLGINHRTAPVELRESIAVTADRLPAFLRNFRTKFPEPAECVLLSTCNRTELYVARPTGVEPSIEALRLFLAEQTGTDVQRITAASIHREQQPAVHHLFRVTAGLDAMAVGETQIIGQVRRGYETARDAGVAGPALHRVFQRALHDVRAAHRSSGVDGLRQSISSMAVEFAGNLFESFTDKTVVGLGAGEIAKSTLQRMLEKKPKRTWIVNRTPEAGQRLAKTLGLSMANDAESSDKSSGRASDSGGDSGRNSPGGEGGARAWEELDEVLVEADVVMTGTSATEPVITVERFKPLLKRRRHRPLFLIDLAVPRDVEAAVGTLPNVYLYNIDDLNAALAQIPERQEKILRCEALVRQAADRCMGDAQHQNLGVLIRQLRSKLLAIGDDERQRTQRKMQALHDAGRYDKIEGLLDEHTHRLINKILHLPLSQLDAKGTDTPMGFYAAALRRLFDLGEQPTAPAPDTDDVPADGDA